jgi:hypothetical protein
MHAKKPSTMQAPQGPNRFLRATALRCLAASALCLAAFGARAQSVDLDPLLAQRDVIALQEVGDRIFVGLEGGGLAVLPVADLQAGEIWYAGQDLSGNRVTDLAWTGANLWVATEGGGLTRVTDPAGVPVFRQFTGGNLGGLDLTAVAGTVTDGSERVYYAMDGAGIGQIIDGISGNLYTADQDGLISNTVNALQVWNGQLFVGTPVGVSRFANNVFTDQNAGFGSLVVNDFAIDDAGNLLAATNGGVYRWDNAGSAWVFVRSLGAWVMRLSCRAGETWALGVDNLGNGVLQASSAGVWRTITLTNPRCRAICAGTDVWIGGRTEQTSVSRTLGQAYVGRREAGDLFTLRDFRASVVRNAEGVTFGAGDGYWVGDWTGLGASGFDGTAWRHLWESASVAADSNGIFTSGGNVLSMAAGPDGTIWGGQYTSGILRVDAVTGKVNHLTPANGLSGRSIINLVTHPDGPLIAMHDWADVEKVDVLVDPVHWRNPANWMVLPRTDGLGAGPGVWDAVVQRRDVVWFAVEDVGLVRWDVNGDAAGPGDALTWLDQSDDRWDAPVRYVPGTSLDLGKAVSLAVGPDGSLWAGGNGVVQINYNDVTQTASLVSAVGEKFSTSSQGLVNGNVADLAIDVNGDVWVATRTGLNRIRGTGDNIAVTAWIDLANYYGSETYQTLYSTNVIAQLPGLTYRKLVVDGTGRRLLLSSDQGAVMLTVGSGGGTGEVELAGTYCYPNPWLADATDTSRLKLGGLPDGVSADQPARVAIYDLAGELVYLDPNVTSGEAFWNGTNRLGNLVRTGMYVVHVNWGGKDAVLTLAIVR